MAFKKGDKVVVIAERAGPVTSKYLEKTLKVKDVRNNFGEQICLCEINEGDSWFSALKFKLVKAAKDVVPAVKVPGVFAAGDKVVVKPGQVHRQLELGKVYTVKRYPGIDGNEFLDLEEIDGVFTRRFEHYVEQPLKLEVGCVVVCIDAKESNVLRLKRRYTVEKLYLGLPGQATHIKLEGNGNRYHPRRFKVVEAAQEAFDHDAWVPKVGEKVYIVAKDDARFHAGGMDVHVNDGKEYTITSEGDNGPAYGIRYGVAHHWNWWKTSLWPVKAGKPKQPPAPSKPKAPVVPKDLREHLFQAQTSRGMGGGLCSFAFEGKDGERDLHTAAPCHAALARPLGDSCYSKKAGTEVVAMAYCLRHDIQKVVGKERDAHKVYCDYILNRSPWAVAFITKDIEEAVTKDILMNVEVNKYVMAGACVALRVGQEFPGRVALFKKLLDSGINEHICWIFSCAFKEDGLGGYSFAVWHGGHDVMDGNRDAKEVFRFFKEGYFNAKGTEKDPFRTSHYTYEIANACAKYTEGKGISTWLRNNTKATVSGEGWNRKEKINDESLKAVADIITNIFKEEA